MTPGTGECPTALSSQSQHLSFVDGDKCRRDRLPGSTHIRPGTVPDRLDYRYKWSCRS